MPMLHEVKLSLSDLSAPGFSAMRILSASFPAAAGLDSPGIRTANSSPPRRATMQVLSRSAETREATV
ncbi:Uncharacterised protein [Mycobacterium tuberculosis]|nr:Uncharacterised protein [Mycobacterium tuberculosis]